MEPWEPPIALRPLNVPSVTEATIGHDALRRRIVTMYAGLAAANIAAWGWALMAFHQYPVLLGTAAVAYSLGLRHALDADHIAAIDNVTRALMNTGDRPVGVGLFFSLGHSTIVVVASVVIAATAAGLNGPLHAFRSMGSLVGTLISAGFLLLIASMNIAILRDVYRTFRRVRAGERLPDGDSIPAIGGLLTRVFGPLLRAIRHSWQMFPVGLLFGLGFDTATEIGLLGISAAAAARGMSIWVTLVFPALFTAGMSLVDTTDSVLMLRAYGWAFNRPIRRLYYNVTITVVSVVVALLVGSVEVLGLVAERSGYSGGLWSVVAALNRNFGVVGYGIVALFVASWMISVAVYRLKGDANVDELTIG